MSQVTVQQLAEVVGDGAVVSGGLGIGLARHADAECQAGGAGFGVQLFQQLRIIGRISDNGDEIVVLGRRTDHRRTADIDILDRGGVVGPTRDRLLEGVEVDDHEVAGARTKTDALSLRELFRRFALDPDAPPPAPVDPHEAIPLPW